MIAPPQLPAGNRYPNTIGTRGEQNEAQVVVSGQKHFIPDVIERKIEKFSSSHTKYRNQAQQKASSQEGNNNQTQKQKTKNSKNNLSVMLDQ